MKTAITALAIGLDSVSCMARRAIPDHRRWLHLPAPIYAKWGEAATPPIGIKLNYQAIGSGAGINQINNRTVDFGASDMPVARPISSRNTSCCNSRP